MAPTKLSCPAGATCGYTTEEVEFEAAMELLKMHRDIAHAAPAQLPQGKKPEKFPRPSIDVDTTAEAWNDFYMAWLQYKDEYGLTGQAITRQLYACCTTELATSLSRTTGGAHFTLSEAQLVEHMKGLAVRYQNPAVHVQEFLGLSQQHDEGVRHYLSRLKGVASRCSFEIKCSCGITNSFTEAITRFKLIAGLADTDIKQDILSKSDMSLEETVKAVEGKESGKVAKMKVGTQDAKVSAVKSDSPETPNKPKRCRNCNRTGHSSGQAEREKSCPAWGKKCDSCGKEGHYKACCKSGKKQPTTSTNNEVAEGEAMSVGAFAGIMATMATLNSSLIPKTTGVKVPHMLYDQLKWVTQNPPRHPTINLNVTVSVCGYQENNYRPPPATRRRDTDMCCLADTGCQACCMGLTQLHALGLTRNDLLPPVLNLRAANTSGINIIGVVYIMITGYDRHGKRWRTHQVVYVSEDVEQLLLSNEACAKLGMISSNFPEVGSHNAGDVLSSGVEVQDRVFADVTDMVLPGEDMDLTPCSPNPDGTCSCPRRESPPAPPHYNPDLSHSQLKSLILKHYGASAFNRCTRQTLPMMRGDPMPIIIKAGTKPYAAHTPIQVPLHWEEQVKSDLDRDCALGVLEKVPINTPTTWCARMVVVPKQNGEPRRTVDLQQLNKASVRQTHPNRSPFMLASDVPAGTKKSVLDVWNSFHSVPVVEADRDKLCFVTQWGVYRYRVAPQGYLASGDGYTHRFAQIAKEITNKRTIVDDTVLWSENMEDNFNDVCKLLTVCCEAGLIFNSDKFQFGQDTVDFAGLEITRDGVRPSRKFLESIRALPAPTNITDARSFFGMINQVSNFFAMSPIMEPFRHLLKPNTPFIWDSALQVRFERAKEEIIEKVTEGIKHFEPDRPTCLATDWCKSGLGFFLLQKHCHCKLTGPRCCKDGWRLVLAGGRFTTPAESRYSPTEGELLAVADSLHKARHFVLGCKYLIVAVDHLPLLGLLNSKSLTDIHNPRILALKEKTLWFQFEMVHVPGGMHCGPDYMSRHGQGDGKTATLKEARLHCTMGLVTGWVEKSGNIEEGLKMATVAAIDYMSRHDQEDGTTATFREARQRCTMGLVTGWVEKSGYMEEGLQMATVAAMGHDEDIKAVTFQRIKAEIPNDTELFRLVEAISNTPHDGEFPADLRSYQRLRDDLYVQDGVPMYQRRVIVPSCLRSEVLAGLHAAHQGVVKMHDRAMQAVFWHGLFKDLERVRDSCTYCNKSTPTQAALPPHTPLSPDYPFQMIVMDYCSIKGKSWLICADRFTGWVSTYYFPREAVSTDLVRLMKEYFATFGVAEHISSDEGSQFVSTRFENFLQSWGTDYHKVSSAYNPHSNLRAETAVKTAKRLLTDNTGQDGTPNWAKITRALLQHRNTPLDGIKFSPAQLLFGRPIRDFQPILPGKFKPSEVWVDCGEKRELAMRHRLSLGGEKWSQNTKELSPLPVGQKVFVQNQRGAGKLAKKWDRTGTVVEDKSHDKYAVKIDGSGRLTDRNRRYLRAFKPDTLTSLPAPSQLPPAVPHGRGQEGHGGDLPGHVSGQSDEEGAHLGDSTHQAAASPSAPPRPPPTAASSGPSSPETTQTPRRSTRVRVPNVRYNTEEFDLTRD